MRVSDFFKKLTKSLGPGFITGAADDDPSGISTYSQTAVMFGFSQLWVAFFSYPFMVTVQEMCGRIGMVTGRGLSGVIKKHYSRSILMGAIALLLFANIINIGADLGAMASAVQLLLPVPFVPLLLGITALTLLAEVWVPYPTYARILKYLTFSLLAYVAAAFMVSQPWRDIAIATLVPHVYLSSAYLFNIAAFLGTTISPYLFFWQADEEVEEEVTHGEIKEVGEGKPHLHRDSIAQMRIDTALGMLFSNLITFFIIISVASTLGVAGITSIDTAAQAAEALRPIAGDFAFVLFTLGILGTGLLAVPVLAGSAGYAVAEIFGWHEGLGKRFGQARGFYLVVSLATLLGLLVNFSSISPMKMLYYAAMFNGVLAPPLLVLILLIANNKKIMGEHTNGRLSNWLGITITVIMSGIALALLGQWMLG